MCIYARAVYRGLIFVSMCRYVTRILLAAVKLFFVARVRMVPETLVAITRNHR